jgi:hypothetical protein
MGMSGHVNAGHLWACVKVDDFCDPTSTGTLNHVKPLEYVYECAFTTDCM